MRTTAKLESPANIAAAKHNPPIRTHQTTAPLAFREIPNPMLDPVGPAPNPTPRTTNPKPTLPATPSLARLPELTARKRRNRGNEPINLLKKKDLARESGENRPPFRAQETHFRANRTHLAPLPPQPIIKVSPFSKDSRDR